MSKIYTVILWILALLFVVILFMILGSVIKEGYEDPLAPPEDIHDSNHWNSMNTRKKK